MPETWVQATVVLAVVVPGFVYQASRRHVAGPDPEHADFSARLLHAIVGTAIFAGLYALLFGSLIREYLVQPAKALEDVDDLGLYFILFGLGIPWLVARTWYYVESSLWYTRVSAGLSDRLGLRRSWDPTPSAWDFAFSRGAAGWVRVRFADGTWLGGWFGAESYASSFPNPQELFVQEGWVIDDDGTFTDVCHAPGGMVIRCTAAVSVDFLPAEIDTESHPDEEN
jgi:hypothetical protein